MKSIKVNIFPFLAILAGFSCSQPDTQTMERKHLIEAVYASGIIEAVGQFELRSQSEGILVDILVEEGERVDANQELFLVSSPSQAARLSNLEVTYELALRNAGRGSPPLLELEQAVAQAKEKYLLDSVNYSRYKALLDQKATSQSAYDIARNAFESSKIAWKRNMTLLEAARDQRKKDLQLASIELKAAREEDGFFRVVSQQPGVLFQVEREQGEFVRRGDLLGVLGGIDGYIARLRVDEKDISRIKQGQQVLLKIDAYPDRNYTAVLSKIYAKVDPRDQLLPVDAALIEPLPGDFTGLALEANIIIREKEDAWVIPRNLLHDGDSVLILKDGEQRKIKVELGLRTLSEVEIVSGLDAETQLVKR